MIAVLAGAFAAAVVLVCRPAYRSSSPRAPSPRAPTPPRQPFAPWTAALERRRVRALAVMVATAVTTWRAGPLRALAAAVVLAAFLHVQAERCRAERRAGTDEAWRRALGRLEGALRAGAELGRALREAADGAGREHEVARRLRRASRHLSLGGAAAQAFPAPQRESERQVASSLAVAEHLGIQPGAVLQAVAANVVADEQARRDRRVALASAWATVRLLALLPVAGIALGAAVGGSTGAFLLGSPAGALVLLAAAVLEAGGLLWAARIGRAE